MGVVGTGTNGVGDLDALLGSPRSGWGDDGRAGWSMANGEGGRCSLVAGM